MKLLVQLVSFVLCSVKGWVLPVLALIPGEQEKEDKLDHCAGFCDPEMERHYVRAYREWTVHAWTNPLVEWYRLEPQRAAKLSSGVILALLLTHLL